MAKKNKKTSSKRGAERVNKSAWIRAQPGSLSAREVVDRAEGQGISLSLAQVYTARSTAKRRPTGKSPRSAAAGAKRGPGRPKAIEPKKAISGDLRRQFMVMAVRIGTDEAKRLLERIADVEGGN